MAGRTLYRTFRPRKFQDVSGQDHVTDILENQIRQGTPGHAYLFCGTRGTGKTTSARILANAVNCLHPVDGSPCGECEVCRAFEQDAFVDVIEIDAASNNGVDNIRDIREKAALLPVTGRYKVYIIDEVHMLSPGAFNALLKILEEPPEHTIFILATTEFRKIPKTIVSRCQRFDFTRIRDEDIVARLAFVADKIGAACEEGVFELIAGQSEGALRDALSLLDQCLAGRSTLTKKEVQHTLGISDAELVRTLCTAVEQGDPARALAAAEKIQDSGTAPVHVLQDCVVELSARLARHAAEQSRAEIILRSLEILLTAQNSLRFAPVPKAVLSAALVRAALPETDKADANLTLRVRRLEDAVAAIRKGGPPVSAPAAVQAEAVPSPVSPAGAPPPPAGPPGKSMSPADMGTNELRRALSARSPALAPAADTILSARKKGSDLILTVRPEDAVVTEILTTPAEEGVVTGVLAELYGTPAPRIVIETDSGGSGQEDDDAQIVSILSDFVGADNVQIIE